MSDRHNESVRIYPCEVADRINIRLPEGMRPRLKEIAKREGRSLNAQVVKFLEVGLSYADR